MNGIAPAGTLLAQFFHRFFMVYILLFATLLHFFVWSIALGSLLMEELYEGWFLINKKA